MMNEYFEWMYSSVFTDSEGNYIPCYHELLQYLNSINFRYTIAMDGNRESDGISLRYHYGWYEHVPDAVIASEIDIYPCSVLEMMVALSRRMESDVMGDSDYGNRTHIWFFNMLESLGIEDMTDENFSEFIVANAIDNWMDHNYASDGKGGLFTLKCPYQDLRRVEIWEQAMWWLNEYVDEEE